MLITSDDRGHYGRVRLRRAAQQGRPQCSTKSRVGPRLLRLRSRAPREGWLLSRPEKNRRKCCRLPSASCLFLTKRGSRNAGPWNENSPAGILPGNGRTKRFVAGAACVIEAPARRLCHVRSLGWRLRPARRITPRALRGSASAAAQHDWATCGGTDTSLDVERFRDTLGYHRPPRAVSADPTTALATGAPRTTRAS